MNAHITTNRTVSTATLARTAVLALALINQILSALGKPLLPIDSTQLEQLISTGFTTVSALVNWWFNNSFTKEAIQADAEFERLKKYHDALAVVKDLEGRMKANKELRYQVAAYTSTKNVAQQLKTAKRPAAFEEQHRAELTACRTAAAYFKANNITKLPSPKKLEAEYAQLASEKAKFYEQYKETKEELLKLKTAKQNVASFFREEEQAQQER